MPKVDTATAPEAVLINTAGGITGGDEFHYHLHCESRARATVTTQASEKIYRSLGDDAVIETTLRIDAHAALEWLPQETILFNGGRLSRRTTVNLAKSARFLGLEATVFGRTAMGETVREGALHDRWRVYHKGRLLFADDTRLEGQIAEQLSRPFLANGHRAVATLIYVNDDAQDMATAIQSLKASAAGTFGASAWDDIMVARFLNVTGQKLRADLTFVLDTIRSGRALPKVWSV